MQQLHVRAMNYTRFIGLNFQYFTIDLQTTVCYYVAEDKTLEVTNMEREYKENKILERMKKIKELSDVIIDILYGILFG